MRPEDVDAPGLLYSSTGEYPSHRQSLKSLNIATGWLLCIPRRTIAIRTKQKQKNLGFQLLALRIARLVSFPSWTRCLAILQACLQKLQSPPPLRWALVALEIPNTNVS